MGVLVYLHPTPDLTSLVFWDAVRGIWSSGVCVCSRPRLTHLWELLTLNERSLDHYISSPLGQYWDQG